MPAAPTPDAVGRHYDELDLFYREVWGLHVHHGLWTTGRETPERAAEALVELIARRAALRGGERVCDVGCGYGETARRLAERYDALVTGLTVSAAQHARAERLTPPSGPTFVLQDWLANALPDAAFDVVLFVESLAHMADRARAFREAARVLRPGGRLVACAWLAGDAVSAPQRRLLLDPICREGRLPALGTLADYHHHLADAGFEVERADDLSRRVRRTWWVVLRRVVRGLVTDGRYRRFLRDASHHERRFVLTPLRLLTAYHTGAFRYVCLSARRPG